MEYNKDVMKRVIFSLLLCTQILGVCACPILFQQTPTPTATRTWLSTATPALSPTKGPTPSSPPPPTSTPTATPTPTPTPIPVAYSIAFASDREGNGEIYRFDGEPPLTNLTRHPAFDWDPTWSPDGARLAFTTHRDGNSEIYIMDANGDNPFNLTNNPAWDYMPVWSPDGTRIAFISERDGNQEIYVINADGTGERRLTVNEVGQDDRSPAWSPDSKRLAFAGVRNGVESIHVMNADGSEETILTVWPLKGTSPAWSPDGSHIAFVGWDEEDKPGLYVMRSDGSDVTWLFRSEAWLGSLTWSPDGAWLLFTSWQDGNHELYVLSRDGSGLQRLTNDLAWDDTPAIRPGKGNSPGLLDPPPTGPIAQPEPSTPLHYGVNLADLGKSYLVRDMGFKWAKSYVDWGGVEPSKGEFKWQDPDNIAKAFSAQGLNIMMRVNMGPQWARPPDTLPTHPPSDPQDFADFMKALVSRYKGTVAAYEIWNEPNLNYAWGMREPDPAEYVLLLKAAYLAAKEIDPDCIIVTGGLSTTGGGGPGAMGDLDYIQGIYDAGGKGYFDALGSHPYGFGQEPDYYDPWGLSFTRAQAQHEVMVANGDGETPLWVTELGWVLQSPWDMGEHQPTAISEAQQATYLVRAYQKASEEWPWMEAVFLFNLDFSSVPWYDSREIMRWYAILNPDRSPRPAYTQLKMMAWGRETR
jgi:Tol biopolymer transport system component